MLKKKAVFLLLAILLIVCFVSYSETDPSWNLSTSKKASNLLGYWGACIADMFYQLLGITCFIIPFSFLSWSYLLYKNEESCCRILNITSLIISIFLICAALSNIKIDSLPAHGGGVVGFFVFRLLVKFFKKFQQFIAPVTLISSIPFLILSLGYTRFFLFLKRFLTKRILKVKFFNFFHKKIKKNHKKIQKFQSEKTKKGSNNVTLQLVQVNNQINIKKTGFIKSLPPIDLLDKKNSSSKQEPFTNLDSTAQKILTILETFAVKGQIRDIIQGPVITTYEFELAVGINSSRVVGLSDEIARSLCIYSIRISVLLNKNLGIEIPNKQRFFFNLIALLEDKGFREQDMMLPIILGKSVTDQTVITDLTRMPHLLIAGAVGSGKSMIINSIILSLLYKYTAIECQLIIVDTKKFELCSYNKIPHLVTPVITELQKALDTLSWVLKEVENRYRLMSYLEVENIANFNIKVLGAKERNLILERKVQTGFNPDTGRPDFESISFRIEKMPFIIVIIDEISDLMLVYKRKIEVLIQRIAQFAGITGIHIIISTQDLSSEVITPTIKSNFLNRIALKMTSKVDSRIILGEIGAERLLGMGDMLYMENSKKIIRIHGPFIHEKELERITSFFS